MPLTRIEINGRVEGHDEFNELFEAFFREKKSVQIWSAADSQIDYAVFVQNIETGNYINSMTFEDYQLILLRALYDKKITIDDYATAVFFKSLEHDVGKIECYPITFKYDPNDESSDSDMTQAWKSSFSRLQKRLGEERWYELAYQLSRLPPSQNVFVKFSTTIPRLFQKPELRIFMLFFFESIGGGGLCLSDDQKVIVMPSMQAYRIILSFIGRYLSDNKGCISPHFFYRHGNATRKDVEDQLNEAGRVVGLADMITQQNPKKIHNISVEGYLISILTVHDLGHQWHLASFPQEISMKYVPFWVAKMRELQRNSAEWNPATWLMIDFPRANKRLADQKVTQAMKTVIQQQGIIKKITPLEESMAFLLGSFAIGDGRDNASKPYLMGVLSAVYVFWSYILITTQKEINPPFPARTIVNYSQYFFNNITPLMIENSGVKEDEEIEKWNNEFIKLLALYDAQENKGIAYETISPILLLQFYLDRSNISPTCLSQAKQILQFVDFSKVEYLEALEAFIEKVQKNAQPSTKQTKLLTALQQTIAKIDNISQIKITRFFEKNPNKLTPEALLHLACALSEYVQVEKLLNAGVNINAKDHLGRTAGHFLIARKDILKNLSDQYQFYLSEETIKRIFKNRVDFVCYLLEKNLNLDIPHNNKRSVKDILADPPKGCDDDERKMLKDTESEMANYFAYKNPPSSTSMLKM